MERQCHYEISPYANGTWCLRVEGEDEGPQHFDTKAEAIAHATTASSIHGGCTITVRHADGSLQEEFHYGDHDAPEEE